MKSFISKRTYRAIYRLLDRVSPIDGDCGELCGAACCTCTYEPEDFEYTAESDENADNYMGIYLLPGEEKVHEQKDSDWIDWGFIKAEDYEFPDSWHGKVGFIQCKTAPACPRKSRPIQCRTFPLSPYFDEDRVFHVIINADDLPYVCPLIEGHVELNERFVQATYTAWKHLVRDPHIADLVEMDSELLNEDGIEVIVMK